MSTTKKTGGWAAVGEILVGLFGLWVKSKPPAAMEPLDLGGISPQEYLGAELLGVSTQDLLKDPGLRAEAFVVGCSAEERAR